MAVSRRFGVAATLLAVFLWLAFRVNLVTALPVRLANGTSGHVGRVEMLYAGEWGTVCDDGFTNSTCRVICRQLGFTGGECVSQDDDCRAKSFALFHDGSGPIWLDEVNCDGTERTLSECQSNVYNDTNCLHKEDAGCVCDKPDVGGCDRARHRIAAADPALPGFGSVEVKDERGQWGLICDDDWDDVDASVFCLCLGYTDIGSFRAMFNVRHTSNLSILYDSVHCSVANHTPDSVPRTPGRAPHTSGSAPRVPGSAPHTLDPAQTHNLWDCGVTPARPGNCDPHTEAAAVACQALTPRQHAEPELSVSCEGRVMRVCVGGLHPASVPPTPRCARDVSSPEPRADSSRDSSKGAEAVDWRLERRRDPFCYSLDLLLCPDVETTFVSRHMKQYCHNASYDLPPLYLPHSPRTEIAPFFDQMISRRVCCSIQLNDSVMAAFISSRRAHPELHVAAPPSYSLTCFPNSSFSGAPYTFPALVERGASLYCRVEVATFDPELVLVVPRCSFRSAAAEPAVNYEFISNKCASSAALNVRFFSFDRRAWGFGFLLPKFDTSSTLFLSCDVRLCDLSLDPKQLCDRTCAPPGGGANGGEESGAETRIWRRGTEAAMEMRDGAGQVGDGPFYVEDVGRGPLISADGVLVFTGEEGLYAAAVLSSYAPPCNPHTLLGWISLPYCALRYYLASCGL